jgi:hypothetical protein
MIFVVQGSILIESRGIEEGETWHGEDDACLTAGPAGATVWRWDFTAGLPQSLASDGLRSFAKLSAPLQTLPEGASLSQTAGSL